MDAGLQPWHWLVLAFAIVIIEIFGIGGFFLGAGAAALVVALCAWTIEGFVWQWQLVVFAVLAVSFTLIYWTRFRRFNLGEQAQTLNRGAAAFIGQSHSALYDSIDGHTKIKIGDALWTVRVEATAGARIKIIAAESMILIGEVVITTQADL